MSSLSFMQRASAIAARCLRGGPGGPPYISPRPSVPSSAFSPRHFSNSSSNISSSSNNNANKRSNSNNSGKNNTNKRSSSNSSSSNSSSSNNSNNNSSSNNSSSNNSSSSSNRSSSSNSTNGTNSSSRKFEVPVLIVGGGPVGLTLALLLRKGGVPCLLVEQQAAATCLPKAHYITNRSMEVWRQLGHLDILVESASPPLSAWRLFVYTTQLADIQQHYIAAKDHFEGCTEEVLLDGRKTYLEKLSPSRMTQLSQDLLLPLLYKAAAATPTGGAPNSHGVAQTPQLSVHRKQAPNETHQRLQETAAAAASPPQGEQHPANLQLMLNARWLTAMRDTSSNTSNSGGNSSISSGPLVSLVEISDSETNTSSVVEIKSDLLIACDGANSTVRRWSGAHLTGGPPLQHFLNITFQSRELAEIIQSQAGGAPKGGPLGKGEEKREAAAVGDAEGCVGGPHAEEGGTPPARGPGYEALKKFKNQAMLYFVMGPRVTAVVVCHCFQTGMFVCHVPFFFSLQKPSQVANEQQVRSFVKEITGLQTHLSDLRIIDFRVWQMLAKVANQFLPSGPPLRGVPTQGGPSLQEDQRGEGEQQQVKEQQVFSDQFSEVGAPVFPRRGAPWGPLRGKILLVGDAAHCLPPSGGLGMNLGLADCLNAAWKVAQSYHLKKGPFSQQQQQKQQQQQQQQQQEQEEEKDPAGKILRSYEEERRLVAQYTCAVAKNNFAAGRCIPEVFGLYWDKAAAAANGLAAAAAAATAAADIMGLKVLSDTMGAAVLAAGKGVFEALLALGRLPAGVQRAVEPMWRKQLETVRLLLQQEETNLGLKFYGADLGYAYTSSSLQDNFKPPSLHVSESAHSLLPSSWRGARVPHAPLRASLHLTDESPPAIFELSTVDLPALAVPACCYCLLLLSETHEPRIASLLDKWKDTQRAAAAAGSAAPARYTAADFVFGVTWAAEEEPTEAGALLEGGPPPSKPLRLPPESLAVLGGGPPKLRRPSGWRRVASSLQVQREFVSTLLANEKDGKERLNPPLLLLRPDGHITALWGVCTLGEKQLFTCLDALF